MSHSRQRQAREKERERERVRNYRDSYSKHKIYLTNQYPATHTKRSFCIYKHNLCRKHTYLRGMSSTIRSTQKCSVINIRWNTSCVAFFNGKTCAGRSLLPSININGDIYGSIEALLRRLDHPTLMPTLDMHGCMLKTTQNQSEYGDWSVDLRVLMHTASAWCGMLK